MTEKHQVIWKYLKAGMELKGIKAGARIAYYSENKKKIILGEITSISADSSTQEIWEEEINIKFDEPTIGDDPKYFSQGTWNLFGFERNIKLI